MNKVLVVIGTAICIFLIVDLVTVSNKDSGLEELQEQLAVLSLEVQRNKDHADLTNLQAIYGYYVDKAQWDDAADLFTANATLEIAGRGEFIGQDRIRNYLQTRGELSYGRLYNHMQLQPVIHVDANGNTAKARWRSFLQVGHLGQEARWGEATYNNEYIKEDGVWKISKLHSFITFYVEFDRGWNKGGVELPPQLDDVTPDNEQTVKYGAFPEVFVPPYHYKNPVSGRENEYMQ